MNNVQIQIQNQNQQNMQQYYTSNKQFDELNEKNFALPSDANNYMQTFN